MSVYLSKEASRNIEGLIQHDTVIGYTQEVPPEVNITEETNLYKAAQQFSKLLSWIKFAGSAYCNFQMGNYLIESGAKMTSELCRLNRPLLETVDLIQGMMFKTPLVFLVTKSRTLTELNLAWAVFKNLRAFAIKDNQKNLPGLILSITALWATYRLNRSNLPEQWSTRDHCNRLLLFTEFQHILGEPIIQKTVDTEHVALEARINQFVDHVKGLQFPAQAQHVFQANLQALINRGISSRMLLDQAVIPQEMHQDRILKKYSCSITGNPARYPVLVEVRGGLFICERATLNQRMGTVSNISFGQRPLQLIPGLFCFAHEVKIISPIQLAIMNEIEERLTYLASRMAILEGQQVVIRPHGSLAGYLISRLENHGNIVQNMVAKVERFAASMLGGQNSILQMITGCLASVPICGVYFSTRAVAYLEFSLISTFCVLLLGVNRETIKAQRRKYHS